MAKPAPFILGRLYRFIRPLLLALPPESAHRVAMATMAPWQQWLEHGPAAAAVDPVLARDLWGLAFPNPVGLAAGFDKDGELPHVWAALGFGFAEIGTVTALPQAGNPPPRLFRLSAERALVNRLGFNNCGAAAVASGLARKLARHRPAIPLGINIGKSRATPRAGVIDDYRASFAALAGCADYIAVNVSSPNTPGLRAWQAEAALGPLLEALAADNGRLATPRPLLVKVAPDLDDDALRAIVGVARTAGAAGLIATNTTLDRAVLPAGHRLAGEAGGLSGAPLHARATAVVRRLFQLGEGKLPIVGVGGIFSAADAYDMIRAGAALVQVYTGLIYEGPALPRRIAAGLGELLRGDGYASVSAAVGAGA